MLMVWDLHPATDIESSPPPSTMSLSPSPSSRPQPTAYVISFPSPLASIRSHPSTSKEFLVADCHGAVYLTDWRSDPEEGDPGALRHSSLVELIEPSALSVACLDGPSHWSASVDWRSDTVDLQVPYHKLQKITMSNLNYSQNWRCLWAKISLVGHVKTSRRNTVRIRQ